MARTRKATHPIIEADPTYPLSYNRSNKSFYKTIRGKRYYFGQDPDEARRRYDAEVSYLVRGEATPDADDTLTVADLFDHYLTDKHADMGVGRITPRTFNDLTKHLAWVADQLGRDTLVSRLKPANMGELSRAIDAKTTSPSKRKKLHTDAKAPFNWAYKNDLEGYDKPVKFGTAWRPPTEDDVEAWRYQSGRRTFTRDEVHQFIDNANPSLRAAILLGINGGIEGNDVRHLKQSDLDDGWLDYLRIKGKKYRRRIPLWPETLAAIEAAPTRRKPSAKGLLIASRLGTPFKPDETFGILKRRIGIDLDNAGFGKLRHTFRTVADGVADANAIRRVMGHRVGKGAETGYIMEISDDRLQAVVDHVHGWLFG